MIIVGVDMGVEYHAEAWLENGRLIATRLVPDVEPVTPPSDASAPWQRLWRSHRLVIERAHARPEDGRIKLAQVDALNLSAGRVGALHPKPEFVTASQWKGSVDKKLDQQRTLALLTPEERTVLPTRKAELKHVLDAVGIALWAAGRKRLEQGDPGFTGGPGPGSAPEQK